MCLMRKKRPYTLKNSTEIIDPLNRPTKHMIQYIADVLTGKLDTKLCLKDLTCPNFKTIYQMYRSTTSIVAIDFGNPYYDLRLPRILMTGRVADNTLEQLQAVDLEMDMREKIVQLGLSAIEIYKSDIYVEQYGAAISVILSRSLASHSVRHY